MAASRCQYRTRHPERIVQKLYGSVKLVRRLPARLESGWPFGVCIELRLIERDVGQDRAGEVSTPEQHSGEVSVSEVSLAEITVSKIGIDQ
jgi:hypothetical protein